MKKEIINERKRSDAILPAIGITLALITIIFFGLFDVRKYGFEIESGSGTTFYWIVRVLCIILIPLFLWLSFNFIKQVFYRELFFKVSSEGVYVKISNKLIYDVKYEDIEKVSVRRYPNDAYIIFIFLKKPSKYLDEEQLNRMIKARESIPDAGDIAIPFTITNEKEEVILETINYYLNQLK